MLPVGDEMAPATAVLEAPCALAWKAKGAVSLEVDVTGTEMVRRRLALLLLSLSWGAAAERSGGLKVKVERLRKAGLPAAYVTTH